MTLEKWRCRKHISKLMKKTIHHSAEKRSKRSCSSCDIQEQIAQVANNSTCKPILKTMPFRERLRTSGTSSELKIKTRFVIRVRPPRRHRGRVGEGEGGGGKDLRIAPGQLATIPAFIPHSVNCHFLCQYRPLSEPPTELLSCHARYAHGLG